MLMASAFNQSSFKDVPFMHLLLLAVNASIVNIRIIKIISSIKTLDFVNMSRTHLNHVVFKNYKTNVQSAMSDSY